MYVKLYIFYHAASTLSCFAFTGQLLLPIEARLMAVEAANMPVEAMDHLEHSSLLCGLLRCGHDNVWGAGWTDGYGAAGIAGGLCMNVSV